VTQAPTLSVRWFVHMHGESVLYGLDPYGRCEYCGEPWRYDPDVETAGQWVTL